MHLAENVDAASRVLRDPWIRELIRRTRTVSGRGIVRVVKDVCVALQLDNARAESVRNTAILFRDHPDVAQQLLDQFEREQTTMNTATSVSEKRVLRAADLYSGQRFPFVWNGWPCELRAGWGVTGKKRFTVDYILNRADLTTSDESVSSVYTSQSGFSVRVSFPMHPVGEFSDVFRWFVDRESEPVDVCGVPVRPLVKVLHDSRELSSEYFNEHRANISTPHNQTAPHLDRELGLLFFDFECGMSSMPLPQRLCLQSEAFRSAYMLACLKHYFGIETEEIEYEPVAEEAPKESQSSSKDVTEDQMNALRNILAGSREVGLTQPMREWLLELLQLSKNLSSNVQSNEFDFTTETAAERVLDELGHAWKKDGLLDTVMRAMGTKFRFRAYLMGSKVRILLVNLEDLERCLERM